MGKYAAQQDLALRLLAAKGGPLTITRRATGTLDPVRGTRSADVVTGTFAGVAIAPSSAAKLGVDLSGKDAREIHLAMKGAAFTPAPGDTVLLYGAPWRIFWAQIVDPAMDGAVMLTAFAEKGA